MKNLLCFLFLAIFVTATAPALAADYTADEIAFMTSKAVFEDPATEKKMRSIMPDAMTKLNTVTSGTTGAVTIPALAATTASSGATLVGVYDVGTYFTATALEGVLQELGLSRSKLALTTSGNGASLIGVYDVATYFAGENVEAVLAEIGLELSTTMALIDTPIAGEVLVADALGQATGGSTLLSDLALASEIVSKFEATGNIQDIVNNALPGGSFPVTPADGFRIFCTADGGAFIEGKIYEYATATGWDTGTNVLAGEMVQTRDGNWILGGATLTDSILLTDYASDVEVATLGLIRAVDAVLDGTGIPAAPADGYRVLCSTTGGGFTEGKVYTYDATGVAYDSGVAVSNGQAFVVKTSPYDFIVYGTTGTQSLSQKLETPECQSLSIASTDVGGSKATDADADWIGATIYSITPVSGCDVYIAGHSVAGDGAVTVQLSAAPTVGPCVLNVCTFL